MSAPIGIAAATDAGCVCSACGRNLAVVDGYAASGTVQTAADARAVAASGCGNLTAVDHDDTDAKLIAADGSIVGVRPRGQLAAAVAVGLRPDGQTVVAADGNAFCGV